MSVNTHSVRKLAALLILGITAQAWAGLSFGQSYADLSGEAKLVVDYLRQDWAKPTRSTSIPLAVENLGRAPDEGIRYEVWQFFRNNKVFHRNLTYWGVNNYLLSDEEKRLAKYLVLAFEEKGTLPGIDDAARDLSKDPIWVRDRLKVLARGGLLEADASAPIKFKMADGWKNWGGPLRYTYHTVHLKGEKPFQSF